jgi:formylmethanofuran:tetrahydromethanopterin formyltransferase
MQSSMLVVIEASAVLAVHVYAGHYGGKLGAYLWTECFRRLALRSLC